MKQCISSTRDGFRILKDRSDMPKDISELDLQRMHANQICYLFLNKNLHLCDIVRLLRDDRGNVVATLLKEGVIEERRHKPRKESAVFGCLN